MWSPLKDNRNSIAKKKGEINMPKAAWIGLGMTAGAAAIPRMEMARAAREAQHEPPTYEPDAQAEPPAPESGVVDPSGNGRDYGEIPADG